MPVQQTQEIGGHVVCAVFGLRCIVRIAFTREALNISRGQVAKRSKRTSGRRFITAALTAAALLAWLKPWGVMK